MKTKKMGIGAIGLKKRCAKCKRRISRTDTIIADSMFIYHVACYDLMIDEAHAARERQERIDFTGKEK